jgi:nucleotide-binding universal stress UspA family protein
VENVMLMERVRSILFPVEIAESTKQILPLAAEMVRMGIDEIRLLHVVKPVDVMSEPGILEEQKEAVLGYRRDLLSLGVPRVKGEVVIGSPWTEIVQRASSPKISSIVMGSHGKGLLERVFLGSQTRNVLHHTNRPLLVLRMAPGIRKGGQADLFSHILYTTDFSPGAENCIPLLEEMAAARPGSLSIAFVQDLMPAGDVSGTKATVKTEQALTRLKEHFEGAGYPLVSTEVRTGDARTELLQLIQEIHPTLLVMGAKGKEEMGIREKTLGSVVDLLVHHAPCHVFVVR